MKEIIGASVTVSNAQKNVEIDQLMPRIHDRLRMLIADRITRIAVKEIVSEFSTEYRVYLVIADPNDYWYDVEREARRMTGGELSLMAFPVSLGDEVQLR